MSKSNPQSVVPKRLHGFSIRAIIGRLTWHELVAIPLVASAVVGYLFREVILNWFRISEEASIIYFGIGIVPVGVWLLVMFGTALVKKRLLISRYRLFVATLILLPGFMIIGSLFQSYHGLFSVFTLGGEISLGGLIGETLAGGNFAGAILRATILFIASFSVFLPRRTLWLVGFFGRCALYLYVILIMAVKLLTKMYSDERLTRSGLQAEETSESTRKGLLSKLGNHSEVGEKDFIRFEDEFSPNTNEYMNDMPAVDWEVDTEGKNPRTIGHSNRLDGPLFGTTNEAFVSSQENTLGSPDKQRENLVSTNISSVVKTNRLWSINGDHTENMESSLDSDVVREELAVNLDKDDVSLASRGTSTWVTPPLGLLTLSDEQGLSSDQIDETAQTIKQTLAEYDIEVEGGHIKPGPTVTMYGLIPGWVRKTRQVKQTNEGGEPLLDENGKQIVTMVEQKTRVKVDSILSREKDLSLALKTPSIRLETPVMGRAQVGIEIPNSTISPVTLRGVMESDEFEKLRHEGELPVAFGKGSGGETVVIDLVDMPHLLIAGSTGSGKSVCLNTIVSCLIMEKAPVDMRLLLIDPKRVELTPYNGIPHLLSPVVVNVDEVVGMLKGLIKEMMNRYRSMEELGVRNIQAYNERLPEDKMPFLVVVVDELADLMMTAAFDVEQSLCRLAQLGRATGIHLVIATQRPSVDVVTGLIKANFPSRISFGVTSYIDSRTILDTPGAEKLLGRGDMLYLPRDASRPQRLQGVFISDKEIEEVVRFWKTSPMGWMQKLVLRPEKVDDINASDTSQSYSEIDALFHKAVELAHSHNKISTSLLQRRMRIGYPRAARLMDELELHGIVGPSDGSKSREVLAQSI